MIACEISLPPSMLRSKLIKLIVFERREVRLLYIGGTGFRSHTSPTVFVPVLCLYYVYYACTVPTLPVLCLFITTHCQVVSLSFLN